MTSAFAQDAKTSTAATAMNNNRVQADPGQMAGKRAERLAKDLNLNDDQKTKIVEILKSEAANRGTKDRRAMAVETDAKIKAVLNDDQIAKWDAVKAQRMEARKARMQESQDNNSGE